jgi:hypothetical protein
LTAQQYFIVPQDIVLTAQQYYFTSRQCVDSTTVLLYFKALC